MPSESFVIESLNSDLLFTINKKRVAKGKQPISIKIKDFKLGNYKSEGT